ncbi:MAG: hypothetical protein KatS3mg019_0944 [Fimbriimonadales bacterium]|nr:MAG: hypothetical protein KatS3mg019_0944 [Fimbriimonadales bacterium]
MGLSRGGKEKDRTVPVAWTVVSKRSTPCRDKTVPATKRPVAWTVLSKRSTPCRDKTVPATRLLVAWTVLSKRSTPCRNKNVPATKPPVAWTVLSKHLVARTRLSVLRGFSWLGQSCPSVSPCRDSLVPATRVGEWSCTTRCGFPVLIRYISSSATYLYRRCPFWELLRVCVAWYERKQAYFGIGRRGEHIQPRTGANV